MWRWDIDAPVQSNTVSMIQEKKISKGFLLTFKH